MTAGQRTSRRSWPKAAVLTALLCSTVVMGGCADAIVAGCVEGLFFLGVAATFAVAAEGIESAFDSPEYYYEYERQRELPEEYHIHHCEQCRRQQ